MISNDTSESFLSRLIELHSGLALTVCCVFILAFGLTLNRVVVDYAQKHERHISLNISQAWFPASIRELLRR